MGNVLDVLGCSGRGDKILSASREGDVEEVSKILSVAPILAKYSSFGTRLSPLHLASARGHVEVVKLLLERGADPNVRNHCGQTPLMHACNFGHSGVVQVLMIHEADIAKFDFVMGRSAIHFAASKGQTECLRLILADLVPSSWKPGRSLGSEEERSLAENLFLQVNVRAECELSPLHLAAMQGHTDTCQLLLDLGARVNAKTSQDGMEFDLRGSGLSIGGGSLPLHYAACNGNIVTVQVLLSRGADKFAKNYNGWIPQDLARMYNHPLVEALLDPASTEAIPALPPSRFISLPLKSIVELARVFRKEKNVENSTETCGVCFERETQVESEECQHRLCVNCALKLCSTGSLHVSKVSDDAFGCITCPFCRKEILNFKKIVDSQS